MPESDDSDRLLLARVAQSRDPVAFSEIMRRYQCMVFGTGLRIAGSVSDAEDVTQETFLELATNASRIESSLAGWLHRAACSRALQLLRSEKARREREQSYAQTHAANASWQQYEPLIDAALQELPAAQRQLLIEYFLCQKTQAKLAAELQLSPATLSRQIAEAAESLVERLRDRNVELSLAALTAALSTQMQYTISATLKAALGKMALSQFASAAVPAAALTGGLAFMNVKLLLGACALIALTVLATYTVLRPPLRVATPPPPAPVVAAPVPPPAPAPAAVTAEEADALLRAIENNDSAAVKALISTTPALLDEHLSRYDNALPLAVAADQGRMDVIKQLVALGATSPVQLDRALARAYGHARRDVAAYLLSLGANPNGWHTNEYYGKPPIAQACEFLDPDGITLAVEEGADPNFHTPTASGSAPLGWVLGTYMRIPERKHGCIDALIKAGIACPDSAVMALHRGRVDLLTAWLDKDPALARRVLSDQEIFFPELGVTEATSSTHAPLHGATLLHLAIEYHEYEIAALLLKRGANINVRANGTPSGHTPLFHAVISFFGDSTEATRFVLGHGGNPGLTADIHLNRPMLGLPAGTELKAITALQYAEKFSNFRNIVNVESIQLLRPQSAAPAPESATKVDF